MSQQINSPEVVGVFAIIVIASIILVLGVLQLFHSLKNSRNARHSWSRRADDQIFKAVEEARRDFR